MLLLEKFSKSFKSLVGIELTVCYILITSYSSWQLDMLAGGCEVIVLNDNWVLPISVGRLQI